MNTLVGRRKQLVLPDYNNPITLASTFTMFFIDKIANIRAEFPLLESSLPPYSFEWMDSIMPYCTVLLESFTMITSEEFIKIVSVMNKTTCSSDLSLQVVNISSTDYYRYHYVCLIFVYPLVRSLLPVNQP